MMRSFMQRLCDIYIYEDSTNATKLVGKRADA